MRFKVIVHTPAGSYQHVIKAEGVEAAKARALKAHPTAQVIQVQDMMGEAV